MSSAVQKPIFPPWNFDGWKAVDDRVRGGSSVSHLEAIKLDLDEPSSLEDEKGVEKVHGARFWGHLDIDTLGGAGFASQRYIFGPLPLQLPPAKYNGICIDLVSPPHASKTTASEFTLVLKTSLSPPSPPDHPRVPPEPQPASLSYETSFNLDSTSKSTTKVGTGKHQLCIPFSDFKATYRGREIDHSDPKWQPLHSEEIYEMSIMCRSGFGKQQGDFELLIASISGWRKGDSHLGLTEGEKEGGGWMKWVYGLWSGLVGWCAGWFTRDQGHVRLDDDKV